MQNEKQIHVGLPFMSAGKHEWTEGFGIPREVPPHEPPIDWFIYWQEDEPIVPTNEEEGDFDEVF